MFSRYNIDGTSLEAKTLCLTYDDGPGKYTGEIARFLSSEGVKATFFVVGKYAVHQLELLKEMKALGHLIANHTYEHPDLPYYCGVNGDIQDQIVRTDTLIREFAKDDTVFFRAPYGKWSPEVADELNRNLLSSHMHIGPIHWEIPGIDCHYWNLGKSVDETVETYFNEITKEGRGIIVMHDEIADMDIVKPANKTLELTKALIPALKKAGYRFVSLDEIPAIKEIQMANDLVYLNIDGKKALNTSGSGLSLGSKNHQSFKICFTGSGKIQIQNSNGKYFYVCPQKDTRLSLSETESQFTEFDYIHVRDNSFMLRTYNGSYLCTDKSDGSVLSATAPFMRQAGIFNFSYPSFSSQRKLSLKQRLTLIWKRLLFIKSKVLRG